MLAAQHSDTPQDLTHARSVLPHVVLVLPIILSVRREEQATALDRTRSAGWGLQQARTGRRPTLRELVALLVHLRTMNPSMQRHGT